MMFPPPRLEDIGFMLWGSLWEPMIAAALEVPTDTIHKWVEDPSLIPRDLEQKLSYVAKSRSEEIDLAQAMLFQRGLNRNREIKEHDDEA